MRLYTTAQLDRAKRELFWLGFVAGCVVFVPLGFALGVWL